MTQYNVIILFWCKWLYCVAQPQLINPDTVNVWRISILGRINDWLSILWLAVKWLWSSYVIEVVKVWLAVCGRERRNAQWPAGLRNINVCSICLPLFGYRLFIYIVLPVLLLLHLFRTFILRYCSGGTYLLRAMFCSLSILLFMILGACSSRT
jgi:hypothetical protein